MPRRTLIATAALAAVATTVAPLPASAEEELTYEQHEFRSNPKKGPEEQVTLEVPADWDRDRLNRVAVGFFDYSVHTRNIIVDLSPLSDTPEEMRTRVREMRDLPDRYYREYDFRVNDDDAEISVRWVFAYRDAPTDDTWSYTSVFLMDDEELVIDGRYKQKEELQEIRRHVVASFEIQE